MNVRVNIKVDKEYIQTFMDELNSGKYFLPSFQRQYVWDEDDIKDVIDSIIKNYPIGTIILWKPSTASSISEIDPFSRPLLDDRGERRGEVFYVIDGQQRLTSLLLLFNSWKIKRGGEEITSAPISYNPSNKRFYKSTKRGIDLSKLIKAFYQYDSDALTELKNTTSEGSFKEMEGMMKRILGYPISICIMETSQEDEKTFREMAEAFIRVNKYGIRIGNIELMLSFLAGAISGELKENIRKLYDELYRIFEIDLQPVIRFVFSNFDLKQTQISKAEQFKGNIDKISKYDPIRMKDILSNCERAMKLTIKVLGKELGINNSRLLPSQTALIPIASYLYTKGINSLDSLEDEDVKNIINWFVLTSFNGYYSSQTDTKLDKDLEVLEGKVYFPYEELIENMKNKKAKVKITREDIKRGLNINVLRRQGRAHLFMLYAVLVRNRADDWSGVLLHQRNFSEIARHHIFPKEFLEQNLELEDPDAKETNINNLANTTFIHKDINSEIEDRSPEEYMIGYIDSAEKHFVPTEKNLWSIDQYTTFLEYRIIQIYTMEKNFFRDIFE